MSKKRIFIFPLSIVAVAAVFAGCAKKPPGCADPQMANTAQALFVTEGQKLVDDLIKDDPRRIMLRFFKAVNVTFVNVLDHGYAADTRLQRCEATAKITIEGGEVIEGPLKYSAQMTVDQSDAFMMTVDGHEDYIHRLAQVAEQVYRRERWAGVWKGTYACDGFNGATSGPQGPYSVQASMVVRSPEEGKNPEAKLERTTLGGGYESLKGFVTDSKVYLRGRGENNPDDTWTTEFALAVQGTKATGPGRIIAPGIGVLRQCRLSLEMSPPDASAAGRMVQVQKVEKCGEEALCVQASGGQTYATNVYALPEDQLAKLDAAAKQRGSLCLHGVSGEGQRLDFESVAPRC